MWSTLCWRSNFSQKESLKNLLGLFCQRSETNWDLLDLNFVHARSRHHKDETRYLFTVRTKRVRNNGMKWISKKYFLENFASGYWNDNIQTSFFEELDFFQFNFFELSNIIMSNSRKNVPFMSNFLDYSTKCVMDLDYRMVIFESLLSTFQSNVIF